MHRRFEITANELRPQSLDNYSAECYRVREASLMQETEGECVTQLVQSSSSLVLNKLCGVWAGVAHRQPCVPRKACAEAQQHD